MANSTFLRIEEISGRMETLERAHKKSTRIAILVPAHNEVDSIDRCLAYCSREAGRDNVYLVDDNSTDCTARAASYWTPNVLSVKRGGKAEAVIAGVDHFDLTNRYDAILVMDADSLISPGALDLYDELLEPGVAAVIGHMRVLGSQRGPIAAWRRHQYFYMPAVYLRGAEACGGGMPVTPGFCTAYASDAFKHFEHDTDAPTEDIDWCWQIHRKKLGKIRFAPKAYVETAVPVNLGDYVRQIIRWDRGWFYATRKHKAPLGRQSADFVYFLMASEMLMAWLRALALFLLLFAGLFVQVDIRVLGTDLTGLLAWSLLFDVVVLSFLVLFGAVRTMLVSTMWWLPLFPFMFWLDQAINLYSCLTVTRGLDAVWKPPVRPNSSVKREEVTT